MPHGHSFQPLLMIMGLAFVVPIVVARLKKWIPFPPVVVVLLCGIAIGRSGLQWVQADDVLSFLSLFGFVYLMFLSGMEIDFRRLHTQARRMPRGRPWGSDLFKASILFALTLVGSAGVAWVMLTLGFADMRSFPLMTLILGTTSVGLVMPVLREEEISSSRLGQMILLSAVIADILTIVALSVVLIVSTRGMSWDLIVVFVFGVVLLASIKVGDVVTRRGLLGRVLAGVSSTQIKVRGSLVLLLVFVGLTEAIGLEVILGAFLAGALVSLFTSSEHSLLTHELEVLGYGFFIPVFFVMVGVTFDASVLTGGWRTLELLGLLVAGAYLVKVLPTLLVFKGIFGLRRAAAAGMLLSSRLSLIIAIAAIGQQLGLISRETESAVILLSVVTCIVSPSSFIKLLRRRRASRRKVVVAGAGRIGRELIKRLRTQNMPVVVIEKDPGQLGKLPSGVPVILGAAADPETLRRSDLGSRDSFVAVTGDDSVNLEACLAARDIGSVHQVVARDNNPDNTDLFARNGVVPVDWTGTLAMTLENLVLRPGLVHLLTHEGPQREAFEIPVERLPSERGAIRDFADFSETLFVCVRRDDEMIIPHGDTELRVGDSVLALGPETDRRALCRLLGGECDDDA
ncbi:MAG: hypothetical protein GXP54_01665 [Deltaproteobacteria bacterium]|nr:hypothetical protein [Deltaproteobacteria bacterium]